MEKIEELKAEILKTKAEFYPESLTDEDKEALGLNEPKKDKKQQEENKPLSNNEVIDTLRDNLKHYVASAKETNIQRDQEIKEARGTYSEKAFQDIKPQIEEKYSNKNKQYSENLGNYLNASVEHLEGKLKEVEDIGIIPQEALTEIALLEKLDTIGKKQMQNIVNRYSNNPLVIQVLSQIGKEHKLYFEPKNIDEIIDLPNELRGNVDAILKSKDFRDLTYTQNTLLAENQNGIDFLNERIDNYINGSVEVRG